LQGSFIYILIRQTCVSGSFWLPTTKMHVNIVVTAVLALLFSHIQLVAGMPKQMPSWMKIKHIEKPRPNVIIHQYNSGWWSNPDLYDAKKECVKKFSMPSLKLPSDKCNEVTMDNVIANCKLTNSWISKKPQCFCQAECHGYNSSIIAWVGNSNKFIYLYPKQRKDHRDDFYR